MQVCVLNKDKTPIYMTCEAKARILLRQKKAVIHRKIPFVIRMKVQIDTSNNQYDYDLRIDPGSKTTGMAIVKNKKEVVLLGELHHKKGINEALETRKSLRRGRRNRKTRYRKCKWKEAIRLSQRYKALKKQGKPCKKPSFGKMSREGWIAPSLEARVNQTINLTKKLMKFIPITGIGMELAKFDLQKMENPDIQGIEYQQGTLMGYEVREYLLEKWGRKCSYCEAVNVPLEVEHIVAHSKGGSNRISNLCLACRTCNEEKGSLFLLQWADLIKKKKNKRHQIILKNIPSIERECKKPLKDASAVNVTRWKLYESLKKLNIPVHTQTGAKTKINRIQSGLAKEHYYDALCIFEDRVSFQWKTNEVIEYHAMGRGNRQMARMDKYGFPKGHREQKKTCQGFQTGDKVKAVVSKGKKKGVYEGRVSIRHSGFFNIKTKEQVVQGISWKTCQLIQRNDGWDYKRKNRKMYSLN